MPETPQNLIVHALLAGATLCRRPGPPSSWPPGEKWTHIGDAQQVTCDGCARGLQQAASVRPEGRERR